MTARLAANDRVKGWLLASVVLAAVAGCTPATWSRTDTAIEASLGAALGADYLQSRQIVRDGKEDNPIMGERGQNLAPEIYFPTAFVAHLAVARCLPRPWREVWQGGAIGWQVDVIHTNWQAGYAVTF
jgi:hypothetical protein